MGREFVLGILSLACGGLLWWITEARLDVPRELFAWIGTIFVLLIATTIAVPSLRCFYSRKRREVPMLLVILTGAFSGAVLGYIAWNLSAKKYEIETINSQTEPQSMAPAPIPKPLEPAPPSREKVEPIPGVKPVPKATPPPIIKKDIPTKPKEIIPDKPEETIPIKPRETIAAVLIKKCQVLPQAININTWIQRINSVRIDRQKRNLRPDLQAVIRQIGGPPRQGLTVKEFVDDAVAEATSTLRCLESEGYIRITETTAPGKWYAVDFPNLEFEFVPERLNEFIEGL